MNNTSHIEIKKQQISKVFKDRENGIIVIHYTDKSYDILKVVDDSLSLLNKGLQ